MEELKEPIVSTAHADAWIQDNWNESRLPRNLTGKHEARSRKSVKLAVDRTIEQLGRFLGRHHPRTLLGLAVTGGAVAEFLRGGGAKAQAETLQVAGSPAFSEATATGYRQAQVLFTPNQAVNAYGVAVGWAETCVSGISLGTRAIRWDGSGTVAIELGYLGTNDWEPFGPGSDGETASNAYSINNAGTAVGYAKSYSIHPFHGYYGNCAVRWDAGGTAATALGNLGTDLMGHSDSYAYALNASGTAVGVATKYSRGQGKGFRAVRWDAGGTAATELGNLGMNGAGYTEAHARAINTSGDVVGFAYKWVSDACAGWRAVRWDAGGTTATELGNLGTNSSGTTNAQSWAINDSGTAIGYAEKYVNGGYYGDRAVRWDAGSTMATELGNIGSYNSGVVNSNANAISKTGIIVGRAEVHIPGANLGFRAVRWDAGGTAATELGNLGTNIGGYTDAQAWAVNDSGIAAGYATKYIGGISGGNHATVWLPDASVIDLNDLSIQALGGGTWTLTEAKSMSANGWVAGIGIFDPDGAGPLASYQRAWVAQVGLGGNWLNTTNTDNTWGAGKNWSTGTPAIQLDAVFNTDATYNVEFSADAQARSIVISSGNVTFNLGTHKLHAASKLDIRGATLTVNGTEAIVIDTGGTLSGTGSTNGRISLMAGAHLAPGNSPGTLHTGGLTLVNDIYDWEISPLASDLMDVNGVLDISGTLTVNLIPLNGAMIPDTVTLFEYDTLADPLTMSQVVLSGNWTYTALDTSGNQIRLLGVSAIPEPGSLSLLGLGAFGMLSRRRRRHGKRAENLLGKSPEGSDCDSGRNGSD